MNRGAMAALFLSLAACAEGQSAPDDDGAAAPDAKVVFDASQPPDGAAPPIDAVDADRTPPRDAPTGDHDAPRIDAAPPDVAPPADVSVAPADVGPTVRCGDGIIDPAAGEVCDDGNVADGDACAADCLRVLCEGGSRQHVEPATQTCYWRDTAVTSRASATARCEAAGAALAMFESEPERDAVYPAMGLGGSNRVWIGLQRAAAGWAWDNGAALAYTGFRSGEPSGDGTCVEWGPANSYNDIGCGSSRDFVCERARPGRAR